MRTGREPMVAQREDGDGVVMLVVGARLTGKKWKLLRTSTGDLPGRVSAGVSTYFHRGPSVLKSREGEHRREYVVLQPVSLVLDSHVQVNLQ
jgi:hypothetical protein